MTDFDWDWPSEEHPSFSFELFDMDVQNGAKYTRVPYSKAACIAAIQGKAVPLELHHPLHRLCIIRGMRYHEGFGEQLRGVLPAYTRSLNARQIMSNSTPTFTSSEEIPYCIWHPETASQDTYRQLLQQVDQYPQLTYLIARACAVAGYTELYDELKVLPETHIAEEARENGSIAIYNSIMSANVRYSIMNDYEREVDTSNLTPAHLNGDTAVCWMLDIKQSFDFPKNGYCEVSTGEFVPRSCRGYKDMAFDLTEDMQIDDRDVDEVDENLQNRNSVDRVEVQLLSEPLPADLPTVQKDLLIAMAAYNGNVDRYVRLRRPVPVENENYCCLHGIHHNTFFALWWSRQPKKPWGIQAAINARMIMNNVLSDLPYEDADTPYTIWYPAIARESTYRQLAKVQPGMIPQVLHACIEGSYKTLFDELLSTEGIIPNETLLCVAKQSSDPHFRQALAARLEALNVPARPAPYDEGVGWNGGRQTSNNCIVSVLNNGKISTSADWQFQGLGNWCDASDIELNACLPVSWRLDHRTQDRWRIDLDYKLWPPECQQSTDDETKDVEQQK